MKTKPTDVVVKKEMFDRLVELAVSGYSKDPLLRSMLRDAIKKEIKSVKDL